MAEPQAGLTLFGGFEMTHALSATPIALTVELAFDRMQSARPQRLTLEQDAAERLGAAMATDLAGVIGPLDSYGLVIAGALYDLPELVRPGLPKVDLLLEVYRRSLPDTRFQARLLTLGMAGESFPLAGLVPAANPGAGPLLAIPAVFICPPSQAASLAAKLEQVLLERGRASSHTRACVRAFGVEPVNLHYATLNDLCVLLRFQLDHNRLGGLWQLLEQALFRPHTALRTESDAGNRFMLENATCVTDFPVLARWLEADAANDQGEDGWMRDWAHWHLRQRQYVSGLAAHGIAVRVAPCWSGPVKQGPEGMAAVADGALLPASATAFTEWVWVADNASTKPVHLLLTEQRLPGLGCVAHTGVASDAEGRICWQFNAYPLSMAGVAEIPAHWRAWCADNGVTIAETRSEPPALCPSGRQLAARTPATSD
jgi:hypothetical protein